MPALGLNSERRLQRGSYVPRLESRKNGLERTFRITPLGSIMLKSRSLIVMRDRTNRRICPWRGRKIGWGASCQQNC